MLNVQETLLIVDDEPSIRETTSLVLSEIGYRVRSAEDGFAALREIRQEIPDLLLTDLNMPKMSGFELLSVVRRRFPAIRTIAMSGSFSGDEVPSGVAADGFYQKGCSIAALLRIITLLPNVERPVPRPSNPETPLWIRSDAHDPSSDGYITITCPECLRSFPLALGTDYPQHKTVCIYCQSPIYYAVFQADDEMPSLSFQLKTAAPKLFPPSASNLSY